MPELPEVESIRRSLLFLEGSTLQKLQFSSLAPIEHSSAAQLKKKLQRTRLQQILRRGKYLLLKNHEGKSLVIHLGMSGQLLYFEKIPSSLPKHSHAILSLEKEAGLIYIDARRFGTLSWSEEAQGRDNPFLSRLGPDYDDLEFKFLDYLSRCRQHSGLSLKSLCLHQGVAAGLGNIYACETLYWARLDPRRAVAKTSDAELEKLFYAARQVLQIGIEKGGSSLKDYLDGRGNRGVMKNFLQVYDREAQNTLDGAGKVIRISQNNRSTWFCPELQK